tara:strand:- start:166 stop:312 length:147 start_codon:yes stop_codon:yes gene_type:complete
LDQLVYTLAVVAVDQGPLTVMVVLVQVALVVAVLEDQVQLMLQHRITV